MVEILRWTKEKWEEWEREQAALFPGARYGALSHSSDDWCTALENAIAQRSEEALQRLIQERPYLAQYVTPNTGHHGIWLFSKQVIAVKKPSGSKGLIPDFLAVTRNSDGYQWWILELKRADVQFVNERADALSTTANRALVQCTSYMNHFDRYLQMIQSVTDIPDLLRPKGVILLMGDSQKETDEQRRIRANINESLGDKLMVVSYDRIRRHLNHDRRVTSVSKS